MTVVKKLLTVYICERCGHQWVPRGKTLPTVCSNPACKSPAWNKPRPAKGPGSKKQRVR
jgi:hypothetical protein